MATTKETLGGIHELVARKYLKMLQDDADPNIDSEPISTQEMNVIIKFLKDNDITVEVTPQGTLGKLVALNFTDEEILQARGEMQNENRKYG